MQEYEVVGLITSNSKDGKLYTALYLSCDFPQYRTEKAIRTEGVEVIRETTTIDCSTLHVGDLVRLVYTRGYEDRARLVAIEKVQ